MNWVMHYKRWGIPEDFRVNITKLNRKCNFSFTSLYCQMTFTGWKTTFCAAELKQWLAVRKMYTAGKCLQTQALILILEWQSKFSTEATPHFRVPKAATGREKTPWSTWGIWPLPRSFWVQSERMSKVPYPDCVEFTAPCSATAREVFQREALADLPHHSSWRSRQGGLSCYTCSGQTANPGKSQLVPVSLAWVPPRYLFPHHTPLRLTWHASLGYFKLQNKLQYI